MPSQDHWDNRVLNVYMRCWGLRTGTSISPQPNRVAQPTPVTWRARLQHSYLKALVSSYAVRRAMPAGLRRGGGRRVPVPEAQLQGGRVLLILLLALRRGGVLPVPEAQLFRLLTSA